MAKTRKLDNNFGMRYHIWFGPGVFGSGIFLNDIWLGQECTNADGLDFDIEISSKIVKNYRVHTRLKNINKVIVGLMRDEITGIENNILQFLNKGGQTIAYTYFNGNNMFHFFTRSLRLKWEDDDGKEHEYIKSDK